MISQLLGLVVLGQVSFTWTFKRTSVLDYAPITHLAGVPFVDISVKQNERRTTSYSTYHTAYDNYAYTEKFVDPEWKGNTLLFDQK